MAQNTKPEFSLFPWIFFLVSMGAWLVGKILLEIVTLEYGWPSKPTFFFHSITTITFPCLITNMVQGFFLLRWYPFQLLWWLALTVISSGLIAITSQTPTVIAIYLVILIIQWFLFERSLEGLQWWITANIIAILVFGFIHFVDILLDSHFMSRNEPYYRFIIQSESRHGLYGFMATTFALATTFSLNLFKLRK